MGETDTITLDSIRAPGPALGEPAAPASSDDYRPLMTASDRAHAGGAPAAGATAGTGRRVIRAPRGNQLTCEGWAQEAAYRMIQNNLDPEVAEHPEELIVYGGYGKAARNWPSFDAILRTLTTL